MFRYSPDTSWFRLMSACEKTMSCPKKDPGIYRDNLTLASPNSIHIRTWSGHLLSWRGGEEKKINQATKTTTYVRQETRLLKNGLDQEKIPPGQVQRALKISRLAIKTVNIRRNTESERCD